MSMNMDFRASGLNNSRAPHRHSLSLQFHLLTSTTSRQNERAITSNPHHPPTPKICKFGPPQNSRKNGGAGTTVSTQKRILSLMMAMPFDRSYGASRSMTTQNFGFLLKTSPRAGVISPKQIEFTRFFPNAC